MVSDETIEKLNDLIVINIDSEKGFRDAADKVHGADYKTLFLAIANERLDQGQQLQAEVRMEGDTPAETGSFAGKAHRWWLQVRKAVTSNDDYAVLAEAERGEDRIKHLYEEVLQETAGSPVNDLLTRQYAQVKQRHDQVRDLRDAVKAAS